MSVESTIQWFPGHMTKARRMIAGDLKLVDAVCEIVDSRIPFSSRNPDLDEIISGKPRLIVLNRVDQADPEASRLWVSFFRAGGTVVLETDSKSGKGVSGLPKALYTLLRVKLDYYASRGQSGRKLRAMVVGIPNVGKSSFINRAAGRKATVTSDKPGVTRGKQWIGIGRGLELLDTPGVLWPRFDNRNVAENLAFTGAIRDEIMDVEALSISLLTRMSELFPERLSERYKLELNQEADGYKLLEQAAINRGFLLSGGSVDTGRMAAVLLDEFRGGKLGRVTLEKAIN